MLETAWVLCTYGAQYLVCGLTISLLMVAWGSRRQRQASRRTVLVAAVLVLWIALFLGTDSGYQAWQGIPDSPKEAYSDTGGPGSMLLGGWLPSAVVLGCAHHLLRQAGQIKLPVPEDWRTEDTPYPPPWAEQLPWKGTLQLRFPPGFFDKDDAFFWSYPILYQLEGDVLSAEKDIQRALREYDAGLYGGGYAAEKIRLTIKEVKDEKRKGLSGFSQWQVKFEGFAPFQPKAPLVTYLEVSRWYRPRQKQTAILILRSARPPKDDDPVWKQLRQFRAVIK